jgi:hypothetical protein
MTEMLRDPVESIDEVVASFVDQRKRRQQAEKLLAAATARRLLIRMDNEEQYNADTFMFVATLGDPERYPEQVKILNRAAQLTAGRIVGVAQGGTLGCVGLAGEQPLVMEAYVGNPSNPEGEQSNRRLEALLRFKQIVAHGSVAPYINSVHPIVVKRTGIEDSPYMVTLLCCKSEPFINDSRDNAFDETNQLLVGADEVMEFVTKHNDIAGEKQFAELTTQLARNQLGILAATESYSQATIN